MFASTFTALRGLMKGQQAYPAEAATCHGDRRAVYFPNTLSRADGRKIKTNASVTVLGRAKKNIAGRLFYNSQHVCTYIALSDRLTWVAECVHACACVRERERGRRKKDGSKGERGSERV